jgi:hypothetical protein
MDHPISTLRYVAAKDLEDKGREFDNVPVIGSDGEKLGNVEGFIIDANDGLARHVAVEAGWFIHKHFLIPVGHASSGPDGTFVADITKDRVRNFPGFDPKEFQKFSADDVKRMNSDLVSILTGELAPDSEFDAHFATPEWWSVTFYKFPAETRR